MFSSVKAVERSHFTNGLAAHWGLRRHEEMRFLQLCDCCLVCGLSHGRKCTSSNVELCRKTDFSGERNPSSSSCYDLALYTLGPFHINTRNHGSSSHIITTVKAKAIVDFTLYSNFLLKYWRKMSPWNWKAVCHSKLRNCASCKWWEVIQSWGKMNFFKVLKQQKFPENLICKL